MPLFLEILKIIESLYLDVELFKDVAPIFAVLFCHSFIYFMALRHTENTTEFKANIIAGIATAVFYLGFIKIFNFARYDYVFDIFARIKIVLNEVMIYVRGFLSTNTEILQFIRLTYTLADSLRYGDTGINELYILALRMKIKNIIRKVEVDLIKVFDVFTRDIVYTNNFKVAQTTVLRC